MTTLAELADLCQLALADSGAAVWPQATIEKWVNVAIGAYSGWFPRVATTSIETSAGVRNYDLPAGFQAVLSVEYPAGLEPPSYLSRLSYQALDFWYLTGCYDVYRSDDAAEESELVIAEAPADGETITVFYQADHPHDLASEDTVTVPSIHHELIVAQAVFFALRETELYETGSPTADTLMVSQLAANTERAWKRYMSLLREELRLREPGGAAGPRWRLDRWDG